MVSFVYFDMMRYIFVLKYYLTSFANFLNLGIFQKVFSSYKSLYVKCVKITSEVHSEILRGDAHLWRWLKKLKNFRYFHTPWIRIGFPCSSAGKESACNVGDLRSIPGLGRSPGGGPGNALQCSCLENPHGQRSLAGYGPWGCKESDMTEHAHMELAIIYILQ